jgi:hypothetical protein
MLEHHWNGALLDSIEAVLAYARTMTWKGMQPVVELVTTTYRTGVKLTKKAMNKVETQLQRLPGLDKWFVDIYPPLHAWDTYIFSSPEERTLFFGLFHFLQRRTGEGGRGSAARPLSSGQGVAELEEERLSASGPRHPPAGSAR